ncbi:hypothetical protein M378DRAFT_172076 [Amanita muscaria Koide BX008]|uniref:Uncharacterized protein n=1 Tax=Amanita muscaria (strain Koide BX008) TaxID=946122 RepID=A0A0C2W7N9_AMAMK|nr:hypothetical protein M378DRAFT_172076 [Amanita muscaria Koide BX008]
MDMINATLGPLLIGTLIATFLSGMNALQTILYFRLYPEDTIRIKALSRILDAIDTAFTWVTMWWFFIENFGRMPEIKPEQKLRIYIFLRRL